MNKNTVLLASVALIILLVVCFFSLFESYTEEQTTGWHESARRNPFLAAEKYLNSYGVNISSSFSLQKLFPLNDLDTLFISSRGNIISDSQESKLIDWVNQGGHLIYTPTDFTTSQESTYLLDWLEVEHLFNGYDEELDEPFEASETEEIPKGALEEQLNTEPTDGEMYQEKLTRFTTGDGVDLTISFNDYYRLTHPSIDNPDYQNRAGISLTQYVSSDNDIHLMEFSVGQGRITLITDDEIWQNTEIDLHDNAYLLSTLTKNSQVLRLIIGSDMPSLWILFWRHASELLISMSVLLVLWLCHVARRFTPAKEPPEMHRRSQGEHIHAIAQYHWQQGDPLALLDELREKVQRMAEVKITGFVRLDQSNQFKALSEISKIDPNKLLDAFFIDPKDESTFTQVTRHLQCLETLLRQR